MISRANQEKYFYAALIKHREENLENYYGGGDAMSYAASDYQHTVRDPGDAPPMPHEKQHSQSQYSIMNDEHLRPDNPSSGNSYDPYRPSRYRMTVDGPNSTKVTVHRRGESNGARKAYVQHSLRHANANRIEALRRGGKLPSSSALSKHSGHRVSASRSSLARRSMSRNSVSSSVWPSSPPVAVPVRAVTSHKRGVSFSHLRQSSAANAIYGHDSGKTAAPYTPELQAKAKFSQDAYANNRADTQQSPSERTDVTVRSKKERAATPGARTRPRKSSTPSQFNKGDIRQASSELEKACEEAFFRTSISSSDYTSATEKQNPYDTPPSSVSNRDSSNSHRHGMPARPLPALPAETPNTFIARTLEETRNKLAARSAAEGTYNSAKFEQVLATLEQIMPSPAEAEAEARRITSAPDAKSSDSRGCLPIINEEARHDNSHGRYDASGHRYRSVTAPVSKESRSVEESSTVRMVPESPSPAAPPNIRRHTGEPHPYAKAYEELAKGSNHLSVPGADPRLLRKKSRDSVVVTRKPVPQSAAVVSGEEAVVKKKSSWFRRWKEPQSSLQENQESTNMPPVWEELDDRATKAARPSGLVRGKQPPPLILGPPPAADESKGFSKWFGKMGRGEKKDHDKSPGSAASHQSLFSTSPPSPLPPTTPTSAGEPVTRSWFARFLRLRPETRTLAYNVPRARTRQELFRLLKDWQRHGIQDLVYFPQDNSITARVDKINSLDIKPVVFRIELFVVLQNGKKAGLSLARCQQVRGAASSFRKVVEVLEKVSRERGLLIEDEEKRRELCEIVT